MSGPRAQAARALRWAWICWRLPLLALLVLTAVAAFSLPERRELAAVWPILVPERAVLEEVGKQAVEQPLHVLMAAAPICLSRQLAGVPWYGWAITPLLIYREWSQWPSKRWWDPPLDWAFLSLGVAVATWRRRRLVGSPQRSARSPSHPLRRKYASRPPATPSIRASAKG